MKREYISPAMEVIHIELEFMIAASTTTQDSPNNDTGVGMSNERRGSWGDLWDQSPTQ